MKKNPITLETYVVLILVLLVFVLFSIEMGVAYFMSTLINTAFYLLINVAFYIMALAVLTGAIAGIFSEFGVLSLFNIILYPLVRFIYRLPGVAGIGVLSAYLSDNPAIISLIREKEFKKRFKDYQIPVLVNLSTSFGMGLIIAVFFLTLPAKLGSEVDGFGNFTTATLIGIVAAVVGSIVSVGLLTYFSKKYHHVPKKDKPIKTLEGEEYYRETRNGSFVNRFLESALDGGKNGVEIGIQIIPGILVISTVILMLTNTMPAGGYSGAALEGVGYLPQIGQYLMFIFKPLFGFQNPEAIAFPLISLGSAGAAIGIVPDFITNGYITIRDIAVFTAIGTTWSGYLSTHVSMMDGVGSRGLTGKAILSHTIGGLVSGVVANYLFMLFTLIFG